MQPKKKPQNAPNYNEDGFTVELVGGVNVSNFLNTFQLNAHLFEDFQNGDIGWSVTYDKAATVMSGELGVQGAAKLYPCVSLDTIQNSKDVTWFIGTDKGFSDNGNGLEVTHLFDDEGNYLGTGAGMNKSYGKSMEDFGPDITIGSTQKVITQGKVNMPTLYNDMIRMTTDFMEDPVGSELGHFYGLSY